MTFTESTIEQAAIDWLKDLGYSYAFGPEIAFDGSVHVVRLQNILPFQSKFDKEIEYMR